MPTKRFARRGAAAVGPLVAIEPRPSVEGVVGAGPSHAHDLVLGVTYVWAHVLIQDMFFNSSLKISLKLEDYHQALIIHTN